MQHRSYLILVYVSLLLFYIKTNAIPQNILL